MVISKKTLLFQGYRGVQHFPGGSNFFQGGGVQMLISIETHIACDFRGALIRTPYPPLDPHMIIRRQQHFIRVCSIC